MGLLRSCSCAAGQGRTRRIVSNRPPRQPGVVGYSCSVVTGVRALQGVVPTAQRAAIVVGVELPVYDITKKHLILSGLMGDTIFAHFV